VTIAPAKEDVYAMEEHVISCTISDIPSLISGVLWTDANNDDGYKPDDGRYNSNSKSQISSLKLSVNDLANLKGSAASHIFTCKISVGSSNTEVIATQTITIFSPSKLI
jgi:hypothetical protein